MVSKSEEVSPRQDDTPRRSTRLRQKTPIELEPILPLIRALVQTEVVSLEHDVGGEKVTRERPRAVAFSGFDCSSTKPPVDRVDGSAEHQSTSIRALTCVKDELETMIRGNELKLAVIHCLERMVAFLTETIKDDESLRTLCAESISRATSAPYPTGRLMGPIKFYADQFGKIILRLKGEPSCLFLERHLSDLLCRTIRHHLRLLLNPPPPRLGPADIHYDERSKSFSKICELVELSTTDEKNKEVAIDIERLPSLVNEAAKIVCSYFGSNNLLDPSFHVSTINPTFCDSDASQRQIPKRNNIRIPPLTLVEVDTVKEDMYQAFDVLVTASATNFLLGLLSKPAVQAEIKRLGGWGDVETLATTLWRYELWESHLDYEHFVLFSNFQTLYERLSSIKVALEAAQQTARVSLNDLGARFRVNALKKTKDQLCRLYPEIRVIDEALKDGWEAVRAFPTVSTK